MYKDVEIYKKTKWVNGKIKFENKILEIDDNKNKIVIPYDKIDSIAREKETTILVYFNENSNEITVRMKLQKGDHEKLVISYQKDMPTIEPQIISYNKELEDAIDNVENDTKKMFIRVISGLISIILIILLSFIKLSNNYKLIFIILIVVIINIMIFINTFINKKNQ